MGNHPLSSKPPGSKFGFEADCRAMPARRISSLLWMCSPPKCQPPLSPGRSTSPNESIGDECEVNLSHLCGCVSFRGLRLQPIFSSLSLSLLLSLSLSLSLSFCVVLFFSRWVGPSFPLGTLGVAFSFAFRPPPTALRLEKKSSRRPPEALQDMLRSYQAGEMDSVSQVVAGGPGNRAGPQRSGRGAWSNLKPFLVFIYIYISFSLFYYYRYFSSLSLSFLCFFRGGGC